MTTAQRPLPMPIYGCAEISCADEVSYPADMLYWFGGNDTYKAGWYCEYCLDEASVYGEKHWTDMAEIRLDKELAARGLTR